MRVLVRDLLSLLGGGTYGVVVSYKDFSPMRISAGARNENWFPTSIVNIEMEFVNFPNYRTIDTISSLVCSV